MTRRWWRRLGESQHGGAALVAGDAKSEDGVLGNVICDVGGQGGGGAREGGDSTRVEVGKGMRGAWGGPVGHCFGPVQNEPDTFLFI
jgi:hypothetical protein